MKRALAVALALVAASAAAAHADDALPRLPLKPTEGLFRTQLAMRRNQSPMPAGQQRQIQAKPRKRPVRASATPAATKPAAHAQLSLGIAVDGAGLSPRGATTAGTVYNEGDARNYSPARAYGFGEAFVGTHGLVIPGISAYLASQFQFAPATERQVPIMRAWDRVDPFQIRTAWTEADGIFETGALRTLRVRGGRQYVYGPAVAHVDGLSASWKNTRVKLAAYLGSRVPDWFYSKSDAPEPRGLVSGGELSLVLRRGKSPIAVRARGLAYQGQTHSDLTLDWTARRDLVLAISTRLAGRELAREHVTARYRWNEDTRIVVDADLRHTADWLWDYELRDADPTGPKRYLDLGPKLPRIGLKVRAGTVLLDNIDVLVFGGFAFDNRGDDPTPSFTSQGWLEGGSALEIRMRRTFALALSGLTRVYNRSDAELEDRVTDVEDQAALLAWPTRNVGERSLVEGGITGKFLGGTRRLSVTGELYARRTRYAKLYRDDAVVGPDLEAVLDPVELHGGGRFVLEAWVTPAIRVRTEYELSNRLFVAYETDGLKSLRILVEGSY